MGALAHVSQRRACAEDQLLIIYFRPSGPAPVRGASSDRQIDSRPAPAPPRPEPDAILILRTQYMLFQYTTLEYS